LQALRERNPSIPAKPSGSRSKEDFSRNTGELSVGLTVKHNVTYCRGDPAVTTKVSIIEPRSATARCHTKTRTLGEVTSRRHGRAELARGFRPGEGLSRERPQPLASVYTFALRLEERAGPFARQTQGSKPVAHLQRTEWKGQNHDQPFRKNSDRLVLSVKCSVSKT